MNFLSDLSDKSDESDESDIIENKKAANRGLFVIIWYGAFLLYEVL